ncbi:Na+:H+ antiporter, NhaC family [Terribacillus halophilus]|uniref:Na+:H+ antiporter, NhaC family n=1 Tax=Terribacillus halophilus TaxID=361279 RepID=A0A1G6U2M9_9BACI|nr:Na+/H+ antiporter NhaC [Terribacillus halophilus]SDD34795.1 Na+:H+ antiporter, NhaC family [Terribacillus halophilus]
MTQKQPLFIQALLPLVALAVAAFFSLFYWNAGMLMPLIISLIVTSVLGVLLGHKWSDLESYMGKGIQRALPAVYILIIVGIIIGSWISSGVIPTLIYYGLDLIHPSIFIPSVALATGVLSMALGSSFASIGTVGLAFIAVGDSMGFPLALVAGAIISGAYLGDKFSPLSETTNVAASMANVDLFSHIRHMLWDTIPAFLLSVLIYWIVGLNYASEVKSIEEIRTINTHLADTFVIHPLLLLVPVLTVIALIKKYPTLPSLILISFVGAILAYIVQGASVTEIIGAMTNGYSGDTGLESLNNLLHRGGITSMMGTIGLVLVATALGGMLEDIGVLKTITETFINRVKSTGSLIGSTVLSALVVGFATGAQILAVILPIRTFKQAFEDRNLAAKNLSRCVEAAGAVGINMVPWSVPAFFAAGVLGVSPYDYIPFAFFIFLVPLINVIYGYTGLSIAKKENGKEEGAKHAS